MALETEPGRPVLADEPRGQVPEIALHVQGDGARTRHAELTRRGAIPIGDSGAKGVVGSDSSETVMRRIAAVATLMLGIAVPVDLHAEATRLAAPNVVEISDRLVTSGQPSASALSSL